MHKGVSRIAQNQLISSALVILYLVGVFAGDCDDVKRFIGQGEKDKCNVCVKGVDNMVECSTAYCGKGCAYHGQIYRVGEHFEAIDECNTCSCTDEGVFCTERWCDRPGCYYNGRYYDLSTTYTSVDGCNTCTCRPGGGTTCTSRSCEQIKDERCFYNDQYHAKGESFSEVYGCNTCTCTSSLDVVCSILPRCPIVQCVDDDGTVYDSGDYYVKDCHICKCRTQGRIVCDDEPIANCTDMDSSSDGDIRCTVEDRVYCPGEPFYDIERGCGTCWCLTNGDIHCPNASCDSTAMKYSVHCLLLTFLLHLAKSISHKIEKYS